MAELTTSMENNPRLGRTAVMARRRDRKARLYGLAYLLAATGLAVLHDEVMTLPSGRFGHDLEQIMLGSMLVLGMLGGLLLLEGRRPFEDAIIGPSERTRPKLVVRKRAAGQAEDGGQWDTRAGVALVLAERAIKTAAPRRDLTGGDALDRRPAS